MESTKRLAIADSNTLLREGLKRLLDGGAKDWRVVGEAGNDVDTMDLVETDKPDVLLLDLNIPKLEAVPILLTIKERNLPTKVLILSLYPDEAKILNTAKAGSRGYLLKSAPSAMFAEATREILKGRVWVDRQVACADQFALLAHGANLGNETGIQINPLDVLSRRELEILHLIARGLTNEEIAKKLFISLPTVKTHASHIFGKLNVNNRTQAALLLMQARSRNSDHFPVDVFSHPAVRQQTAL